MTINKKQSLRNNEYYNLQSEFDDLYDRSKNNNKFKDLMSLIMSEENIMLAYRNIKSNKGSKTAGVNNHTLSYINNMDNDRMIKYFKDRLRNLQPHKVKRVMIPKSDGSKRPLGIPSIEDRIVQQCIKQVIEPICEAKFHPHSYGFRPNRDTRHAVSRLVSLANRSKFQYVVEIDIKGFFDNVDHGKLLKQIWSMGIQDKSLLKVISKLLKSEVVGFGVQSKGTPQGGILSPLLSNIVLNELDWWISSQWETFETDKDLTCVRGNRVDQSHKYRALKKTNMKEMFIVRYADDFKIMCRTRNQADRIMMATKMWLKERLNLDINENKSAIVNLKRKSSEFLGIRLKLRKKNNKYVIMSNMTDKAKKVVTKELKDRVNKVKKNSGTYEAAMLNSHTLGVHGYYNMATHISKDFADIGFVINKCIDIRLRNHMRNVKIDNDTFDKFYGGYKGKMRAVNGITLYPITYIQHKKLMNFSQDKCDYTVEGRKKIHDNLKVSKSVLKHLRTSFDKNNSVEYNDNKISLYCGQYGLCGVTGDKLVLSNMYVHHKIPKILGGSDEYKNLIYVTGEVHRLIHATIPEVINQYKKFMTVENLTKINKFRELVGNYKI